MKKEGRSTVAVLEEALPKIIAGINFSKAMRWITNSDVTFSRPMRWLFAVHGDHHLSFGGVRSDGTTRSCEREVTSRTRTSPPMRPSTTRCWPRTPSWPSTKRVSKIWSEAKDAGKSVGDIPENAREGLLEEVANLVEAPNGHG